MKDLKGLKLAALYGYECLMAKKMNINEALFSFIAKREGLEETEKALKNLVAFHWYKLIAAYHGFEDPFDRRVVRAYWTGNRYLRRIKKEKGFLFPFHNFTILDSIHRSKTALSLIDECKISVGQVLETRGEDLIVEYYPLIKRSSGLCLADFIEERVIKKGFLKQVQKGDFITFHYGIARERISKVQARSLWKRTQDSLDLFKELKFLKES